MTVKRRTLWFSDDDWTKMQAAAEARGMNVSRLIRELVRDRGKKPAPAGKGIEPRPAPKPRPRRAESAAQRAVTAAQRQHRIDEVLHRVSRAD